MSLLINLRHLEKKNLSLEGELTAAELEVDSLDELIHFKEPIEYELEVQKLEDSLLVQGTLRGVMECECARCLKPFQQEIDLENWAVHLPLEGEEKVAVVNDSVDLTPIIREDIVLSFPQHPLCDEKCGGLPKVVAAKLKKARGTGQLEKVSAWAELDKLKLK